MNNIISFSGGKDSTAMLLLAQERGLSIHSAVFFDTGWEFPEMLQHIATIEKNISVPLVRLKPKRSFAEELSINGWPSITRRWCTRRKIDALNKYCKQNNGVQLIGFSVDEIKRTESKEMKKPPPKRFPLIEWGISEVGALAYSLSRGYTWDELYNHFDRVSCFCCPLKRIDEYRKLRKHYPKLWQRMLMMGKSLKEVKRFYGWKTVRDLEARFQNEDKQIPMFDRCEVAV